MRIGSDPVTALQQLTTVKRPAGRQAPGRVGTALWLMLFARFGIARFRPSLNLRHGGHFVARKVLPLIALGAVRLFGIRTAHSRFCHAEISFHAVCLYYARKEHKLGLSLSIPGFDDKASPPLDHMLFFFAA